MKISKEQRHDRNEEMRKDEMENFKWGRGMAMLVSYKVELKAQSHVSGVREIKNWARATQGSQDFKN